MERGKTITRWAFVGLLGWGTSCGSVLAVEPGQAAPPIELADGTSPVSLGKLQGKLVYLDFWASWCGPCRQSFPWMNEMQAKYGSRGLQVVGVNLDAKSEDATKFLSRTPASFLVGFDPAGDTAKRYQIKGMPSSVLIGADGRVIKVHTGFLSTERQALENAIVAALPLSR